MPRVGYKDLDEWIEWVNDHVNPDTSPYEAYYILSAGQLILEPMRNKKERNYIVGHFSKENMVKALEFLKAQKIRVSRPDYYDWRIDGVKVATQD